MSACAKLFALLPSAVSTLLSAPGLRCTASAGGGMTSEEAAPSNTLMLLFAAVLLLSALSLWILKRLLEGCLLHL
jgi:hypothetical protein